MQTSSEEESRLRKNQRGYAWDKRTGYTSRYHKERRANPETWAKATIVTIRARAKRFNTPFEIVADDLVLPKVCPVLGIPIILGAGTRAMTNPNAPSVDRFDNTKGYTKENVRVISNRANLLKRDATVEEMKAVVRYMENG